MPFKSKAQQKLCYSLKSRGKAGSWNCSQWSKETKVKKLPNKVTSVKKYKS